VSICTPDKNIYGIGSKFAKGDWYQGWKHPDPDRFSLFSEQNMKRHAEMRKKFQGLYSMSSLLSYESFVDDCIDIFMTRLDEAVVSRSVMDMARWLQCYAFDVIGKITYSERFGFLDHGQDVSSMISSLDTQMIYATLIGIYDKLHAPLFNILQKIPGSGPAGLQYLMDFVTRKIREREEEQQEKQGTQPQTQTGNDVVPEDFLDKMLQAQRKNPDKVTPYHVWMMAMSNIIAGSDTTAVSLSSILYHVITTPTALSRLRQEISEKGLDNRRTTFQDSQDMPYLQAVLKEGLRMHPATGLPLWRVVPEEGVQIGDHFLPAGTNVGLNSWVAHYDTNVYGPDAHIFRPERWEEAKTQDADQLKRMEANFMPFGLGSRTCIGRHISFLEMSKLIPELLKMFDFTLAMPKEEWKSKNYWFVKPEKLPCTISRR